MQCSDSSRMQLILLLCLLYLSGLHPSLCQLVNRSHSCSFEPPEATCGWTVPPIEGYSGIVSASNPPASGPSVDVNPGNANGHYFYYYANQSLSTSSDQVLLFPSHQFVCGLSFSYAISGPLDLEIVRENLGVDTVYMSQGASPTSSPGAWDSVSYQYNDVLLNAPMSASALYFEVSRFDLGEAPLESDEEVFLALDNVTLTFCLPCDYDALVEPDAIIVGGPERIDIQLRRLNAYQFNASAPVCPNETLVFTVESVVPGFLTPVFSLDSATGQLSVDASGPHLDANGTTAGQVNVSVHVFNSNYTQVTTPHLQLATVPFSIPPTITHTAPPSLSFDITSAFTYQFATVSALGQTLTFDLQATPTELSENASFAILQHGVGVQIKALVAIDTTLPIIVEQEVTPSFSVVITDTFGGVIIATTELRINPSPPLFEQPQYIFDIPEETSRGMFLGPIRLIDPNGGRSLLTPTITPNAEGTSTFFDVIGEDFTDETRAYFTYELVVLHQFNFELVRTVNFDLVARDLEDQSLTSSASVMVNVIPVNEFTPQFVTSRMETYINEGQPRQSLVAIFQAYDQDMGPDGIIDYTITGGNNDGYFDLSGAGFGEVLVSRSPINPGVYTLTVTASDRGSPPRASNATLVVHVAATRDIDCSSDDYGPPLVDSPSPSSMELPVQTNLTLYCQYMADPAVRGYKWQHNSLTLLQDQTDPHYNISSHSLTIESLRRTDGGLYLCNVTNQCGSTAYPYLVHVIDYPNPPQNVHVLATPSPRSLTLSWSMPEGATVITNPLSTPVSGYTVQLLNNGTDQVFRDVLTVPDASITMATVTGLHPGAWYSVRVLARNAAGATPSQVVNITTNSSVPSVENLRLTAMQNNSILVEWELEYTGGFPIILFEIHVMRHLPRGRSRRDTPPDLVYHTDANAGRLVTMAVDTGHTYSVRASATNTLGPSDDQIENVFVGYTDIVSCNFEGVAGEGCVWGVGGEGVVARADAATPPLPVRDASNNPQGHYVSLQAPHSNSALTVLSHTRAGYVCGLTFSYYLTGGAQLSLRTTLSGAVLWSSPSGPPSTPTWEPVALTDVQYLTSLVDEGVEFVLTTGGGSNGSVALDDVVASFCLPCDFRALEGERFDLTYENYSRIFLRTPHIIQIQAVVQDCPNAVLNFSVQRVVPSALLSRFSLVSEDGRNLTLRVEPISPSRAEPNSLGFLQGEVSVLNSDYRSLDTVLSESVLLEFQLLPLAENCSFSTRCEFEEVGVVGADMCAGWTIGGGVRIITGQSSSHAELQNPFTGSYLYTDSAASDSTMALSVIEDNYCGVSFAYSVSPNTEILVMVGGLGSIWSSLEAVPAMATGWSNQSVQIDLQDVQVLANRSVSFVARLASSALAYAALDNITLYPCLDCNTPVCTLTSCIPGHYYSLDHADCMDCPAGYYCPDWRIFPKPCPPGTFSDATAAYSLETCEACAPSTFTIQLASTSCQSCPTGFDCSNASSLPVLQSGGGGGSCPTSSTTEEFPVVTVSLGFALGVVLLACVCLMCLAIWCYRRKQQGEKKARNKRILLASSHSSNSIGGLNLSMVRSGKQLKGKTNRGGNSVRTMTSFLSDDDNADYFEDNSWMEAEDLTTPGGRGKGQPQGGGGERGGNELSLVFHNSDFDDGEEEIEMSSKSSTTQRTSDF